jgi:hypothetical protein
MRLSSPRQALQLFTASLVSVALSLAAAATAFANGGGTQFP